MVKPFQAMKGEQDSDCLILAISVDRKHPRSESTLITFQGDFVNPAGKVHRTSISRYPIERSVRGLWTY